MITFIELIIVCASGFIMAHLTSNEKQKSAFARFIALCLGPALLITLFILSCLISSTVQHIYSTIIVLLAIGKCISYKEGLNKKPEL